MTNPNKFSSEQPAQAESKLTADDYARGLDAIIRIATTPEIKEGMSNVEQFEATIDGLFEKYPKKVNLDDEQFDSLTLENKSHGMSGAWGVNSKKGYTITRRKNDTTEIDPKNPRIKYTLDFPPRFIMDKTIWNTLQVKEGSNILQTLHVEETADGKVRQKVYAEDESENIDLLLNFMKESVPHKPVFRYFFPGKNN